MSSGGLLRRAESRPSAWRVEAALGVALVLSAGLFASRGPDGVAAQEPSRAGLVVMLGDGEVRELCVELASPEVTGTDLLLASGLDVRVEPSSMGVMVCRIEHAGCPEGEACMCACQTTGGECSYWAYNVLADGAWAYSEVGASDRVVRDGDVDGWAWGSGSEEGGPVPPLRTFDEICGAVVSASGEDAGAEAVAVGGPTAAADATTDGGTGGAVGYLALVVVIAVLAGVWIWSRRD